MNLQLLENDNALKCKQPVYKKNIPGESSIRIYNLIVTWRAALDLATSVEAFRGLCRAVPAAQRGLAIIQLICCAKPRPCTFTYSRRLEKKWFWQLLFNKTPIIFD